MTNMINHHSSKVLSILIVALTGLSTFVFSKERLIKHEFNSSNPSTGWTPSITTEISCPGTTITEFQNNQFYGVLNSNTEYTIFKKYTFLPPHWSLSVRVDSIVGPATQLSGQSHITFQIDDHTPQIFIGNPNDKLQQQFCQGSQTSQDHFFLIYQNVSHTLDSARVSFTIRGNSGIFFLRHFFLYVDLCHSQCKTCSGPAKEDCVTCPSESQQKDGLCVCNFPLLVHENVCVKECPNRYRRNQAGKECELDVCAQSQGCELCEKERCIKCMSSQFLLDHRCVQVCPVYSQTKDAKCVMKMIDNVESFLMSAAFLDKYFGEGEIRQKGFTIKEFQGNGQFLPSGALTTFTNFFDGRTILGGFMLAGQSASITVSLLNIREHKKIGIGFKFHRNDNWLDHVLTVKIDGKSKYSKTYSHNNFRGSAYGLLMLSDNQEDIYFEFSHAQKIIIVEISTTLTATSLFQSFGITDFFVLGAGCNEKCDSCNEEDPCICYPGKYEFENACIDNCPDGFYPMGQKCLPCSPSCLTCQPPGNQQSCTQCPEETFLLKRECLVNCPQGYIENNETGACDSCHESCDTCSGVLKTDCLSCYPPQLLIKNQGTCVDECETDQYQLDQLCKECYPDCKTCLGGSESDCLSCKEPKVLLPLPTTGKCLEQCPENHFVDKNQKCKKCGIRCKVCKSETDCDECLEGYLLVNNVCTDQCPDKTYPSSNGKGCTTCNENCKNCFGGAEDQCETCPSGKYLEITTNRCVTKCKDDYILILQECQPCHSSCATCSGINHDDCLSCDDDRYLNELAGKCDTDCPEQHFKDEKTNTCQQCNPCCETCDNPDTCLTCLKDLVMQDGLCEPECAQHHFLNGDTCIPCHPTCNTCTGKEENQCISCMKDLLLDLETNTCLENCAENQVEIESTCQNCHISCKQCKGTTETDCVSCDEHHFFDKKEGKCLEECPNMTFPDRETQICEPCHPECLACVNSLLCTQCPHTKTLYQGKCIDECPIHTYFDTSLNECVDCDESCASCNDSDSSSCLSCAEGKFLDESQCKEACPPNKFEKDKSCEYCNESCQTCDGPELNDCLSCPPGILYNPVDKKCYSKCPSHMFPNELNGDCEPCMIQCETCSDETSCKSCKPDYYLFENDCVRKCPSNSFEIEGECFLCDVSCLTCDGPANNNCLSCHPNFQLSQSQKTCNNECESDEYLDEGVCRKCHPTCLTCFNGSENGCLSCPEGKVLDPHNMACLDSCPPYHFVNSQKICDPCKSECQTCENKDSCLTCKEEYFDFNNECISSCPEDTFQDDKICKACDKTCETCKGPGPTNCLTCTADNLLDIQTNECVSKCKSTQFVKDRTCVDCHFSCETCKGPTVNDCITCREGDYFMISTGQCVPSCPEYYFVDINTYCRKCLPECQECTDADSCVSCKNSDEFFLHEGKCVDQCPSSYFFNPILRECQKCHETCLECVGPEANQCIKCKPGVFYLKSKGMCGTICPYGETPVNFICVPCLEKCGCSQSENAMARTVNYALDTPTFDLNQPLPDECFEDNTLKWIVIAVISETSVFIVLGAIVVILDIVNDSKSTQFQPIKQNEPESIELGVRSIVSSEQDLPQQNGGGNNQAPKSQHSFCCSWILAHEVISLLHFPDNLILRISRLGKIFLKYLGVLLLARLDVLLLSMMIYFYQFLVIDLFGAIFQSIPLGFPALFTGWAVQIIATLVILLMISANFPSPNRIFIGIMVVLSLLLYLLWFITEQKDITNEEDIQWTLYFLVTLLADLIVFQSILAMIQYCVTASVVNVKNMSFCQKLFFDEHIFKMLRP